MSASDFFREQLAKELEDPDFQFEHTLASVRIATIDRIVNSLDEAREAAGVSKASLARAVHVEPANVRRLFAAGHRNPTLGTLTDIATALGMKVSIEPMTPAELQQVAAALTTGSTADPIRLTKQPKAAPRTESA